MKKNLLTPAILVMFALSLGACSKSSDKKTNMVLLTQSVWKYQIAGFDLDKNGSVDSEDPSITACSKDDLLTFKTDNTGIFDEGPTKCDPADPQTSTFSWQFKNTEKELEYDGDTYTILSMDDNNLKIYSDIPLSGTTFRVLIVFKH